MLWLPQPNKSCGCVEIEGLQWRMRMSIWWIIYSLFDYNCVVEEYEEILLSYGIVIVLDVVEQNSARRPEGCSGCTVD